MNTNTCVRGPYRWLLVILLLASLPAWSATEIEGLEFNHGIAFFHDLKYPADFTHLDYVNPDAPKGGHLVLPTQTSFNTLSPGNQQSLTAPGLNWTLDSLLIRAGDEVTGFYGRLADGIAVSEDEMAIIFRLHPDARWHDGVPVSPADVAFTLEYRLAQVEGAVWYGFVKEVEQIDERHVAIHLNAPLTLNNIIILQFLQIMPAHYWSVRDPARVSLEPPVGSGPYRVSDVSQGRYVDYERVPDY